MRYIKRRKPSYRQYYDQESTYDCYRTGHTLKIEFHYFKFDFNNIINIINIMYGKNSCLIHNHSFFIFSIVRLQNSSLVSYSTFPNQSRILDINLHSFSCFLFFSRNIRRKSVFFSLEILQIARDWIGTSLLSFLVYVG